MSVDVPSSSRASPPTRPRRAKQIASTRWLLPRLPHHEAKRPSVIRLRICDLVVLAVAPTAVPYTITITQNTDAERSGSL